MIVSLRVGAAVIWDDLIDFCVNKGLYGLGNLAGIPGTVGASPVQNIGAYGEEIANFIEYVECFDLNTNKELRLSRHECEFGYRKSIFQKSTNLLIVSVNFSLSKNSNLSLIIKILKIFHSKMKKSL